MNLQKGKHTPGTHNNQQTRAPYNNNSRIPPNLPVSHHLTQVQRTDNYLRQESGYQQQISGLHHYSVAPVASVTGSPHDMSKQSALPSQAQNNQGLYSNPSGVAGAGNQPPQQQQQSAMPTATSVPPPHPVTPGHRPPPAPGVVHQHQPQLQSRTVFPQRNLIRAAFNPAVWSSPGAMNHAAQQSQNQYGNQVWFPNQFQNIPTQMMRGGQAPNQQIHIGYSNNFSQAPHGYQNVPAAATQQQIMYNPAPGNTAQFVYSHPRPTAAAFYANVPQMAPFGNHVMYPGNQRTGVPNAAPQAAPAPLGKSIIKIQDPNTLADVTTSVLYGGDQNSSNQSLSESSSRKDSVSSEPPTPNQVSDVAIEFAAKVASVATSVVPPRQEPIPEKTQLPTNAGIRLDNMTIPVYHGGISMTDGLPAQAPIHSNIKLENAAHQKRFMTETIPPAARPSCLENITPIRLTPCHPEDVAPPMIEEPVAVYELGQPLDMVQFESSMPETVVQSEQEVVTHSVSKQNHAPSSGSVQLAPSTNVSIPPLVIQETEPPIIPSNLPPLAENVVSETYPVNKTEHNVAMTNSPYVSVVDKNSALASNTAISKPMQASEIKELSEIVKTSPGSFPTIQETSAHGSTPVSALSSETRTSVNVQSSGPNSAEMNYTSVSSIDRVPPREQLVVEKTLPQAAISTPVVQEPSLESPPATQSDVIIVDSSKPQHNGDAREVTSPLQLDSKEAFDARDGKKNKKKKMKELNRKGESKDGGEMDAFVDKEEDSSRSVVSPVLPDSSKSPSPPSVISPAIPAQVTTNVDTDLDEVTEEERKVAEKNEENKRVSQKAIIEPTPVIEPPKPEMPKYQYKEDQWSPLNPEGKKQYDRAFLITLQSKPMSLQKPKGLPNLDVIKDTALQHKLPDLSRQAPPPPSGQTPAIHRNQHDLFMPQYARSSGGSPRPPQGGVNRRQSQQGRDKPKKIIAFSSSLNEDVKLHEASNAWKPTNKNKTLEELNEDEKKTEELYRRVRGILNKLTPQKFATLLDQVTELPIDNESRLKGVIDLVFEKAVDEPNFSVPYANMCKHLMMKAVPADGGQNVNVNFRKLLLTKCQREFEKDIKDEINRDNRLKQIDQAESDEKKKALKDELDEEERKVRRRCLGNIRFIGELYKLNMLTANIMHDCLNKLFKQGDEDSLECLCRLMTTIGKELDEKTSEKAHSKTMDDYFKKMKVIVESRNTSSRVRFMLQDVMDLRTRNWVPRREDNNPKTIEQIHMDVQREAQVQQYQSQQPLPHMPKRMDDRDRRKNRSMQGGGGGGYSGEDGWNTVGGGGKRGGTPFNSFDPSKLPPKITKPIEAEAIQLGPGGRGYASWSRGSSGGGTKAMSQEPESKAPSNRFSALMTQEQPDSRRMMQQSSSSSREPSRGRSGPPQGPQLRNKIPSQNNREKENAIATVMAFKERMVEAKPAEPTTPKAPEVKDVPVAPSPVPVAPEPVSDANELSLEEIENKTKPIIDEFCHTSDFEEAVQCVTELVTQSTVHMFVNAAINLVLERSSQAQTLLGQLFKELVHRKTVSLSQYIQGLQATLDISEDLAIDVPKIWSCLASVIAPMVQDGSMSMAFLKDALKPYVENEVAAKIMPELLHTIANFQGPKRVHELWNSSGLKWSNFLDSSVNESKFIADKKLEFTVHHDVDQSRVKRVSAEEAKKVLDKLLESRKKTGNEEIFDWIDANIGEVLIQTPPYIRALVTAVTESAITMIKGQHQVDTKIFKDRITVLKKYLDNKEELEIQALYALQALVNKLQHPQGMLVHIFNTLYDEEAMSEDAFFQWERSNDQNEQEGKGVAIKSVTSFFTWLQEADEESVEEN